MVFLSLKLRKSSRKPSTNLTDEILASLDQSSTRHPSPTRSTRSSSGATGGDNNNNSNKQFKQSLWLPNLSADKLTISSLSTGGYSGSRRSSNLGSTKTHLSPPPPPIELGLVSRASVSPVSLASTERIATHIPQVKDACESQLIETIPSKCYEDKDKNERPTLGGSSSEFKELVAADNLMNRRRRECNQRPCNKQPYIRCLQWKQATTSRLSEAIVQLGNNNNNNHNSKNQNRRLQAIEAALSTVVTVSTLVGSRHTSTHHLESQHFCCLEHAIQVSGSYLSKLLLSS